jgi:hypothetical protein
MPAKLPVLSVGLGRISFLSPACRRFVFVMQDMDSDFLQLQVQNIVFPMRENAGLFQNQPNFGTGPDNNSFFCLYLRRFQNISF